MPSAEDCATLQAWFDGVDHARAEAEAKWGAGRLPLLVSDDLRARFNRQKAKWSRALQDAWAAPALTRALLDEVELQAGGMKRAWAALEVAAEEAGHRAIAPWVWETTLADGTVLAVVQTDAEGSKVIADGRHVAVYTLREVANVIDALPPALAVAKVVWPGAKVLGETDRSWVKRGDEIPFGDVA